MNKKKFKFIFFNITLFSILLTSLSFYLYFKNNNINSFIKVKISNVVDGDTINAIDNNNKKYIIRLYGIDTPEIKKDSVNEELAIYEDKYGNLAKNYLKNKLSELNNEIYMKIIEKDKYQRYVSICYFDNNFYFKNSLNFNLVQNGFARVHYIQDTNYKQPYYTKDKYQKEFYKVILESQNYAKLHYLGIWQHNQIDIFHKM
ncbi:thermonuclease family protein [Mycoplasmopsis felis]|uniref:thermonuclease family protein n=1 Tax=Mycoplasmopsis felis TaxID=33923 RepID=UPI0021AE6E09|nr:thermonuclease family protein [Mycoplasmopsis felis]MCU9932169.1 thermonuclease family protein [Mycoplasmopsis felis]MCU9937908.1 thermonuclease family protein [Mycoplasmopsis felis]UWV78617.1 thermonuclease family protein [Mycoplasmopsis felis]UWV83638.1 thermonuclease family protein [Mycoplasmopsis felis]UWW01318.1 thermonuclease family protein [Mycoplasmopsis felis]